MKTSFLNQRKLPLVVEMDEHGASVLTPQNFIDLCLEHKEFLRGQLLVWGALLVRGGPALAAADFARFVREFSGKSLIDYVGGASPRVKLGDGVYTSTEYPQNYTLSLHNELSYTFRWPDHLFFSCVTASGQGGETSLGDSRAILKEMDEKVVREFKSRGIRYVRNLHGGRGSGYSWQEAFETDDKSVIEAHCRAGGIRFHWRDDGGLTLTEVRPATALHPTTGEEVWFNQADGFHPSGIDEETYELLTSTMKEEEFRLNSYYGDGMPLDLSALNHAREVIRRQMVLVPWRAGDILILDNLLTAHGRLPFTGARKILLAMT
ncbi:MAG TPA: TauD/TfdA family dioxygenase [Pyrinomonadaceae bacterium]|jgi:alpha-ketoglutarate-dependent taurine dioxygenase|nr:TauD/TfdA family dioxygenase [Pyrinomonadaceae bacterium]